MQWARLQADVKCALRRGAWYRVASVAGLAAIVDVNRQPHQVPSYLLQIVSTPPSRWTVVPRSASAKASHLGDQLGTHYLVCPSCRGRSPLRAASRPKSHACKRCRGVFEVAWDERYLAT